jgi:hypothetical protein
MMDEKDLKQYKNGSKRKNPGQTKKKKEIPVGARFSAPVQTGLGAHAAFYAIGTGSLFRG